MVFPNSPHYLHVQQWCILVWLSVLFPSASKVTSEVGILNFFASPRTDISLDFLSDFLYRLT
jgi:hypothetical protein